MKLVLATRNEGKFKEFLELAGEVGGIEFVPMPEKAQPKEIGDSFLENAIIKARVAALVSKLPAVADDSGLQVDALGGAPGVHSARYCEGSDADRR
ncbi:MAG TPA: non-canonical purine NTP pyrophosphatase, partial [Candidatus Obscuribacterales bacterium]